MFEVLIRAQVQGRGELRKEKGCSLKF